MKHFILLVECPDSKGLIYKITSKLYDTGLNIIKNDEFVEPLNGRFFMRSEFSGECDTEALQNALLEVLPEGAQVSIKDASKRKNLLLMATKESHCLGDILIKHHSGELDANILGVISNHDYLEDLVRRFDIPYFFVDTEGLKRTEHEERVVTLIHDFKKEIDYIVLAKYMRILTPYFVEKFESKIINIHHSFLPAFIGANPYKQAYERGVKIIGATAHYVNNNLDEGPIISQNVVTVNHSYSWQDMQHAGREVEKTVLSQALSLALKDRVFVYGNKTVIF